MNRRTTFAILLLLVESGLAYYIFNHTARERTPTTVILSEEAVTCFDVSNWWDSLAVGTANGTVSYYQRGKTVPQWVYGGASGVFSVLMSGEGDYVLAMDEDYNVPLLFTGRRREHALMEPTAGGLPHTWSPLLGGNSATRPHVGLG